MSDDPAIPLRWINLYVDQLLKAAQDFPPGPMRQAAALRADHAMDMVEAWKGQADKAAVAHSGCVRSTCVCRTQLAADRCEFRRT